MCAADAVRHLRMVVRVPCCGDFAPAPDAGLVLCGQGVHLYRAVALNGSTNRWQRLSSGPRTATAWLAHGFFQGSTRRLFTTLDGMHHTG
jgi:hypothetical protein